MSLPKKHTIRIGLDFDGVVAYNPLRVVRAPITFIKQKIIKNKTTEFYIPTTPLMKFLFWLPHQFSFFPSNGMGDLRHLVEEGNVEAYIVSGRYGYLDRQIPLWLNKRHFEDIFTLVYANEKNEQPHLYKEHMVEKLQLDYFIEDNFDIVKHLTPRVKTKVLWIYNIFDRNTQYPAKYPTLKNALEAIRHETA